jgi:hypothetical protein
MAEPLRVVPPAEPTGPETGPGAGPGAGPVWTLVADAATRLGISERAVRKRIAAGSLEGRTDGRRWWVALPAEPDAEPGPVPRGTWAGPAEPSSGPKTGPGPVPSGTSSAFTPADLEQAIERTGAKYRADLQTMFAELRQVFEVQLRAKDATIAAKDETIAELRRRAEQAEQEHDTLQAQLATPTAGPTGPATTESPPATPRPWWAFWRRL